MSRKIKQEISRAMLAGALVLLSQAAMSGEVQVATAAPEQVRVTLPSDWMEVVAPIEQIGLLVETREQFEALNEAMNEALRKSVANDIARQIELIGFPRTELAIAEVPTRG